MKKEEIRKRMKEGCPICKSKQLVLKDFDSWIVIFCKKCGWKVEDYEH